MSAKAPSIDDVSSPTGASTWFRTPSAVYLHQVGTTLANTWGLSIYIGWALIIDVFTALMLLPLMVKWFKPKYVFGA